MNSAIPSFRNRIFSGDKVIPEIGHIYPWNRVIPPFRNPALIKNSASFSVTFEYKEVKAKSTGFILLAHDEAGLDPESVCLRSRSIQCSFNLALSKHLTLQVTGQFRCSSSGISGCQCLFMGACEAHRKP